MAAAKLTARTPADLKKIVAAYLKKTKMSPTRLSMLATEDLRIVGRLMADNAPRLSLEVADWILTYIEKHPNGEA